LKFILQDRPTGPAVNSFVEIGRILSGASIEENPDEEKGDKLDNICTQLKMSENELKSCEHDTDITKTCRQITKYIYPDVHARAKMLVSSMRAEQLQAVQGKPVRVLYQ
jgi:hypothetical protein